MKLKVECSKKSGIIHNFEELVHEVSNIYGDITVDQKKLVLHYRRINFVPLKPKPVVYSALSVRRVKFEIEYVSECFFDYKMCLMYVKFTGITYKVPADIEW